MATSAAASALLLPRCRRQTCRIVLVTSVVWCLVDLFIFFALFDCVGPDCWLSGGDRKSAGGGGKYGALKFAAEVGALDKGGDGSGYPGEKLFSWKPAPPVTAASAPSQGPLHGEGGKAVQIPAEMEETRKEKFKINQFNLLASEMISLNRSLKDVRLSE